MPRPKKRKVDVAEMTTESNAEAENDMDITGEQQPSCTTPSTASPGSPVLSAVSQRKLDAAADALGEAQAEAQALREVAAKREREEKVAQKLHDAKMRRLDNGDKLKRRKNPMGAACRTYEAIIDLQLAQLVSANARCAAAEAERDAKGAELRLNALLERYLPCESDMCTFCVVLSGAELGCPVELDTHLGCVGAVSTCYMSMV